MLDSTNPQITEALAAGTIDPEVAAVSYDYTWPLVMLACLGIASFIIAFYLRIVDKKKGYGLELPNIQK